MFHLAFQVRGVDPVRHTQWTIGLLAKYLQANGTAIPHDPL